ncbi:GspH/FimT family pseudopilin [Desulfatitalea alkaliphila]|uniref:Type II secretion system protein H n=1 Tax=Desulfatitalea alkaliphila TaxID=2929485 RepID=A0AA41QZQ5_9BACT|nr:GspH/FimT family pseudopilin [Desulfatitalea alkaliphila]MCJ8499309.1 GspH/FimT family pseudopilin [Desulfatitalea alkaliphila]
MNITNIIPSAKPTPVARSGFTVVELLVVISLIAILLSVATPSTMAYLRQRGVREAADQLAMDLQRAKMAAVSRNADSSIVVDTAGNSYRTQLPGRADETTALSRFRGGVAFANIDGQVNTPRITFNSRGITNPGANGSIFLTNDGGAVTIRLTVSAAGGISQSIVTP